jgi:SRSO17 transposase
VKFASKPKIALKQLRRVRGLGVSISYGGGDEVYGRYAGLLGDHERHGEAYAYFVPRNHRIKCRDGKQRRVDELPELDHALFESRPAGPMALR